MDIRIGEWIALTDGYVYWNENDERVTFPTKRAAIEYVGAMRLDPRPTPRVSRHYRGCYTYMPQDCDTGAYGEQIGINRITPGNLDYYKEIVQVQIDEDPFSNE